MSDGRRLLGRSSTMFSREAVWLLQDGLEIESSEQYEVVRRQVLFQDVLFVTYHRMYGAAHLVLTGLVSAFFLSIAILILSVGGADAWPGALVTILIGSPAIVAFVLRLMFRLDVITVFGRRSKASIRFGLRKRRARELYVQICATVRAAQERMAREIAAEDAADAPPQEVSQQEPIPLPPLADAEPR